MARIVLVPGFWLGAWAWDEVADLLRRDGHEVIALTLPGLDPDDPDRLEATAGAQADAIVAALRAGTGRSVLAVHSGAGFPGYAATDRAPERIGATVYVDTGPGVGAMDAEFADRELPLAPWDELGENLDGLSEEQLAEFRRRAVPEPGGVLRTGVELTNPARLHIPSVVLCTSYTSEQYREATEKGYAFVKGLAELKNVRYVDLPTSHWPMWSKPRETARVISEAAARA